MGRLSIKSGIVRIRNSSYEHLRTFQEIRDFAKVFTTAWQEVVDAVNALYATPTAPTTLSRVVGAATAGTVADLAAPGGTTVVTTEVTGAPPTGGFDIQIIFSGVAGAKTFVWTGYYAGSSSHIVEAQVYNYVTSSWDMVSRASYRSGMETQAFDVLPSAHYDAANAEAKMRFYHVSNGVGTHTMNLDYVGLREF